MKNQIDIRPSPIAGRWYPADPGELAASVDGYIQQAQVPDIPGKILALISPHAGHIYSGPVAGYAFKTVLGARPERVIILSPYHAFHTGAILTSGHRSYQTPLGEVPIDQPIREKLSDALLEAAGVELTRVRNDAEHAVEIILPFLQRSLASEFKLLPLMLRNQHPELMKTLGKFLASLIEDQKTLLVASSDLSHFHSAGKAKELDQTIIQAVQELDPDSLYLAERSGKGSACGLGAIAAAIWAVKSSGKARSQVLRYAHSGDITGDRSSVVGYTSAVLTRE